MKLFKLICCIAQVLNVCRIPVVMGGIENSENQYGMSELWKLLNNVSP